MTTYRLLIAIEHALPNWPLVDFRKISLSIACFFGKYIIMEIAAIIFKCSGLINEIEEKNDIKLFEITRINKGYLSLEISKEVGMGGVWFKGMSDNRIDVITYSGYRGEETPRSILIHNEKIEVAAILNMWIEEGIEDRVRKRFFKVKGSDGKTHKIYYDEKEMEWFYMVAD